MKRIIIIEDEIKIRDELSLFLSRNGFDCIQTDDFNNVIEFILSQQADLVLLDINLPLIDGYHICREVRKDSDIPIIIVTSRNSDIDELMSMNFGADDFVTKPYNTQILLARINSLLRRLSTVQEVFTCKGVQLNLSDSTLLYNSDQVDLTKNELRILHLLMRKENQIVSRETIMDTLWQSDAFIDDNTLTVNINRIRKKLEQIGIKDYLITKRGQGYMI